MFAVVLRPVDNKCGGEPSRVVKDAASGDAHEIVVTLVGSN